MKNLLSNWLQGHFQRGEILGFLKKILSYFTLKVKPIIEDQLFSICKWFTNGLLYYRVTYWIRGRQGCHPLEHVWLGQGGFHSLQLSLAHCIADGQWGFAPETKERRNVIICGIPST